MQGFLVVLFAPALFTMTAGEHRQRQLAQQLLAVAAAREQPGTSPSHLMPLGRGGGTNIDCPSEGCHTWDQLLRFRVVLALGLLCTVLALTARNTKALVALVYLALSVAIDVSIAAQRSHSAGSGSGYEFDPICAVLLTEIIKLVVSVALCMRTRHDSGQAVRGQMHMYPSDVAWLAAAALIFTANNVLVWWAIGHNDVSVFGVFRDTMIIWTALLWRCVFKAPLGYTRLGCIAGIVAGLFLNRAGSMWHGSPWTWAFLWVVVMTFCNALGSVINEFALKRSHDLDINLQNAVLYSMCALLCMLLLVGTKPEYLKNPTYFMQGISRWTLLTCTLQALAGLMVSRLLKYTDAVWKTAASCLRGPLLVALASAVPVISGEHDMATVMSAIVVAGSCFYYLVQGPLQLDDAERQVATKMPPKLTSAAGP